MNKLTGCKPKEVFRYFEDLCAIPHGSGNGKAVSDYCMKFAEEHGLKALQDDAWNVILVKEASPGWEAAPTVILQGHLDMVCEKEAGCPIDFLTEGLDLAVDGDFVFAKGTTLGGDDGIAVAMALAILADESLSHPRLECLFTTDEEIGLLGAQALDPSTLEGRRLINLDSEEEGVFTVSCAGGMRSSCRLPLEYQEASGRRYTIGVDGLLGGHSGAEIHKEHGNSNLLMGRLLCALKEQVEFHLASLTGGLMDNAIPRESKALLYVREEDAPLLESLLEKWSAVFQKEFHSSDPGIRVKGVGEGSFTGQAMTPKSRDRLLYLLHMLPNGVVRQSTEIPGLVQTSLNLGILKTDEREALASFSVRSSMESEKRELGRRLRHCVEFLGGRYEEEGDYPGWEYREHSVLRDAMVGVYERLYHTKPEIQAIHAGLECGILSGKLEGLDCVSIGPNLYDVHTPGERLSVSSVQRVYEFLLEVLKELR